MASGEGLLPSSSVSIERPVTGGFFILSSLTRTPRVFLVGLSLSYDWMEPSMFVACFLFVFLSNWRWLWMVFCSEDPCDCVHTGLTFSHTPLDSAFPSAASRPSWSAAHTHGLHGSHVYMTNFPERRRLHWFQYLRHFLMRGAFDNTSNVFNARNFQYVKGNEFLNT